MFLCPKPSWRWSNNVRPSCDSLPGLPPLLSSQSFSPQLLNAHHILLPFLLFLHAVSNVSDDGTAIPGVCKAAKVLSIAVNQKSIQTKTVQSANEEYLPKAVWELQEVLQQQQTRKSPWKTVSSKSLLSILLNARKLKALSHDQSLSSEYQSWAFKIQTQCSNMRAIITMRKRKTNLIPPPKRRYTLTRGLL